MSYAPQVIILEGGTGDINKAFGATENAFCDAVLFTIHTQRRVVTACFFYCDRMRRCNLSRYYSGRILGVIFTDSDWKLHRN